MVCHLIRVSLVAALALTALFSATFVVTQVDRHRFTDVVRSAVAEGTLDWHFTLPFSAREIYPYAICDCLILAMLVLPAGSSRLQDTISPRLPLFDGRMAEGHFPGYPPGPITADPIPGYPPHQVCQGLAAAIATTSSTVTAWYYHRYLHGHRTLAGLMLAVMPFGTASSLLMGVACGLLLLLGGLAARSFWRAIGDRPRDAAFFVIALFLALFHGIEIFGWTFCFAPFDIVLFAFLLFAYRYPLCRLSEANFVVLVAVFGALTAIFEFMTGCIPSAASALLVTIALGKASDAAQLIRRAVLGMLCFLGAIALCFALKLAAVVLAWGPSELGSFWSQLAVHISAHRWSVAPEIAAQMSVFGVTPELIQDNRALASLYALLKIAFYSFILGLGSHVAGAVIVVGGSMLAIGRGVLAMVRAASRTALAWETVMLAAAVMPLLWYLVFLSHTIVHSYFMVRPMVWPAAIFAVSLAYWHCGRAVLSPT